MRPLLTAVKFSLKEQLNNRFALGLLVLFVPVWYWLLGAMTPSAAVPFRFAATNSFIQINGHHLIFLTAGINVLSLILGFMFFHSARRSLAFDQRLTRAGLNRAQFMAAKVIALAITTAALSLYTMLVLLAYWHSPVNIVEVWLSFWLVSLLYGSFGLLLGVVLNSELAGFFIVIMLSQVDVFLQIPIDNPAANQSYLHLLPSYGAVQLTTAGAFTHVFPMRQFLLSLSWIAGFLGLALVAFYLRTRYKSSLQRVQALSTKP
ncbi:MAG: hypothetical protein ABI221_03945 [Candidatus Saccharimonadales bacterium]